ncbi:MAG: HAMP domain-containing histidine kinase [Actinomycetota bacterium]|nr:HAMP domain-containing histidine kinase [Acidothermales bacterium]MDQ3432982.1 HAMP domain-containing histidine kinase [Actinomycetota bacterium]
MRRQLILMVAATTSIVLIALLVPMAVLIERFAVEDALAKAGFEVQATETVVAFNDKGAVNVHLDDLNNNEDGLATTVLYPGGQSIGPDGQVTADVLRARDRGVAIVNDSTEGAEVLVPVSVDDEDRPVIRVLVTSQGFNSDVYLSWAILVGLGLGVLALAILVADRLGRAFVRPVVQLAETAGRLESGDLSARVEPAGPPEVREVGTALNRLAARVGHLLAAERENVADISHRLRTPVTVLRLDAEALRDPEERSRLATDVDEMNRMVDDVIREARRPMREGLGAACDALTVVDDRTRFWNVLAEDQNRSVRVDLPEEPVPVRATREDLATAVDALLGNVFSHTPEGTAFAVRLEGVNGQGACLVVSDEGSGFPAGRDVLRRGESQGGSTGLGLDIVRRTAEASGGRVLIGRTPSGGVEVTVELGPPQR